MSSFQFLVPSFLKKIDATLLKNVPDRWSTRLHWVLYFGVVCSLILLFISYIISYDVRLDSVVSSWLGFVMLFTFLVIIVWLLYLLRFNVFKRFGNISSFHFLKHFLIFFFVFAFAVGFNYIPALVETWKTNLKYGDVEIEQDMYTMNKLLCKIEKKNFNKEWTKNLYKLDKRVNTIHENEINTEEAAVAATVDVATTEYKDKNDTWIRLDSIDYENNKRNADSIKIVNDSMFVSYTCPTFLLFENYNSNNAGIKYTSNLELYHTIINNDSTYEIQPLKDSLNVLLSKYANSDYVEYNDYSINDSPLEKIKKTYSTSAVNQSFNNIIRKKFRFSNHNIREIIYPIYFIALALTLLLWIFRHTHTKSYFWGVLIAVVIVIFTGLCIAIFRFIKDYDLLYLLLAYFLLFGFLSFQLFKAKKYNIWQTASLYFFTLFCPFILNIILGIYYGFKHQAFDNKYYNKPTPVGEFDKWFGNEQLYQEYTIWIGFVVFLIILHFYLSKLYTKAFSLPQD